MSTDNDTAHNKDDSDQLAAGNGLLAWEQRVRTPLKVKVGCDRDANPTSPDFGGARKLATRPVRVIRAARPITNWVLADEVEGGIPAWWGGCGQHALWQ